MAAINCRCAISHTPNAPVIVNFNSSAIARPAAAINTRSAGDLLERYLERFSARR
jgi:hypothetical protein